VSGHDHARDGRSAGIGLLTVSDTRTTATDRSGAVARRLFEAAGHRVVVDRILPDEPDRVAELVHEWLGREDCDIVLVSGGTGISARDRTYEAVTRLLDQRLDGFGELFRMLSWQEIGSAAMLSRAVGGIARGKPLFAVPGAPAAVELALARLVLPAIAHLLSELDKQR
jgi:molybdenum cofactor biosynthesis protein B